jgi:hypothetical protein
MMMNWTAKSNLEGPEGLELVSELAVLAQGKAAQPQFGSVSFRIRTIGAVPAIPVIRNNLN